MPDAARERRQGMSDGESSMEICPCRDGLTVGIKMRRHDVSG